MEPDNVPHEPDAASKVQNAVKRNASSTESTNFKRSCLSNAMVSSCVHTPAPIKASKVHNAKRHASTTQKANVASKRRCEANVTASTSASVSPVTIVSTPESVDLKLPPDVEWQKQAISILQRHTIIPFVDRSSTPAPPNFAQCPEIHPHLLDKATGDGHCGFRALSKSITGTEDNHSAFRAAIVAFMRYSCAGRRRPWLVSNRSIDEYIQQVNMDTTGWMSDVELQFIASLLQITIYVFTTVNRRSGERRWIAYNPVFRTIECMAPTADHHLHLHHNRDGNHFDRVIFSA